MSLTAVATLTVLVPGAAQAVAQDKPDFTGSWLLESASSATDMPQSLLVTQPTHTPCGPQTGVGMLQSALPVQASTAALCR
jgi:hypothetical protein